MGFIIVKRFNYPNPKKKHKFQAWSLFAQDLKIQTKRISIIKHESIISITDKLKIFHLWNRDLERLSFEIKTNQLPKLAIMIYNAIVARIQLKITVINAKCSFSWAIKSIHEQHFGTIVKNKIVISYPHFTHRIEHIKRKALTTADRYILQHL